MALQALLAGARNGSRTITAAIVAAHNHCSSWQLPSQARAQQRHAEHSSGEKKQKQEQEAKDERDKRLNSHRLFYPGSLYDPSELAPDCKMPPPAKRKKVSTEYRNAVKSMARRTEFRNASALPHFLTSEGKLLSRRKTGLRMKVHRSIGRHIKLARQLAIIPHIGRPPLRKADPYSHGAKTKR